MCKVIYLHPSLVTQPTNPAMPGDTAVTYGLLILPQNQTWHYPLGEVPSFRADVSIIAILRVYFKTENSSGFPSPVFGNDKTVKDVSFTPPYWDKVLMHNVLKADGCSQGTEVARRARAPR